MFAVLLLAGLSCVLDGGDIEQRAASPACAETENQLFHGFVIDSARFGGGLMVDLWSTEYALARRSDLRESNPIGVSKNARIWLKGAMAAGVIAICHHLRRSGHPTFAKWLGRLALALQVGAATSNVVKAHR